MAKGSHPDTTELYLRLQSSFASAELIREQCKVPSIAAGVLYEGELVFSNGVGYRDIDKQLPTNENVQYMLMSISKLFVVACIGILVDQGLLDWNLPVSNYVPAFKTEDNPITGESATFVDILRHSGGLSNPVVSMIGPFGKVLLKEQDFWEAVKETPTGNEQGPYLNREWKYSNIGYAVLAMAVQEVSKMRYSEFVQRNILDPLEMRDTSVGEDQLEMSDSIAFPYAQLDNGRWERLNCEFTSSDNTPILAAFGMRSSVSDILKFCAAVMHAEAEERGEDPEKPMILNNVTQNPLKEMDGIRNGAYWTKPHDDPYQNESQFHLGWMEAVMPSCQLGWGSYNELTNSGSNRTAYRYIIGTASPKRQFFKHTGLGLGTSISVYTFPTTCSAVVVFCNGLNLGDPADFTAQLLIQALFDLKPLIDIMPWVKLETEERQKEFKRTTMREWCHDQDIAHPQSPLSDYVGEFRGLGITLTVDYTENRIGLQLLLARPDICLPLEYYSKDRFSFLPKTRDDWLRGAWLDFDYYLTGILDFKRDSTGKVDGLNWRWEKPSGPSWFRRLAGPH